MMEVIQSTGAFILALGILITFHEFGHFWVARRCDVKILRFSVGFGRALWKRHFGADRSEFVIAALPLGGYVKMLDEREGEVAIDERQRAFNNMSLPRRFAIVLAGPVFNFLFAILAYWLIYTIGIEGLKPVVGEVRQGSIAIQAGFQKDDEIIAIDGHPTPTWNALMDMLVGKVVKGRAAVFTVTDNAGVQSDLVVELGGITVDDMAGGKLMETLGIVPKRPVIPAVIGEVIAGGAAENSGLLPGDRVIAVDGEPVNDWRDWVKLIRAHPKQQLMVDIRRGTDNLTVAIVPDLVVTDLGEKIGRIGAIVDNAFQDDRSYLATESYSIFTAVYKAIDKTFDMSIMTLRILGKMILGQASVKNLSGPISIAQYAGETAGLGIIAFLGFLAIVSVSLGVLNLLPIPLLDGGHLMYYLIELVKGSPVSESTQIIGQQVGLAALLGLMSIAFYNDILRLIG